MNRYLLYRLFYAIPVLLGVSILVFTLIHITPGDPARLMLGAAARTEDVERLRHELGLDRPLYIQYFSWLGRLFTGDLGESIALRRPVLDEVLNKFGNTLILSTAATVISFTLGILLGVLSAVKRGSIFDRLVMLLATFGLSLPSFWFGMMLIILFSVKLGMLPGSGMTAAFGGGGFSDVARHLVLPAISLAVVPLAVIARYTRSSMLEAISQDYVRTARAKGLGENRVITRHVIRNAMVTVVTMLGLQIGFMLGGAVYVENVFSWPGIGHMLVNAILKRDIPLIQGGVLLVACSYVLVNLVTDLIYGYLDPRIRLS